ncbi:hypothetical protein An15g03930 [Aspergillus niger]|uniref:Uncharacterized protein n=2 Tax=Aspergillus niger TaxID=5061 RepID=A5ABY9_ASPNC|nr:hypothetical protein An15g03930 [Aspergillus niger]CAK97261.1 hypothetical protein An15g03930 [Aspergillus niger]
MGVPRIDYDGADKSQIEAFGRDHPDHPRVPRPVSATIMRDPERSREKRRGDEARRGLVQTEEWEKRPGTASQTRVAGGPDLPLVLPCVGPVSPGLLGTRTENSSKAPAIQRAQPRFARGWQPWIAILPRMNPRDMPAPSRVAIASEKWFDCWEVATLMGRDRPSMLMEGSVHVYHPWT